MGKRSDRELIQAEEQAPRVSAAEALRRNLLYAMYKTVSEGDVAEIVREQVAKAKKGDTKAAKLVLVDMLKAGETDGVPLEGSNVNVGIAVNVNGNGKSQGPRENAAIIREEAAKIIAASGPTRFRDLAVRLGITIEDAIGACDHHPWFDSQTDGCHISQKCMNDLILPLRGKDEDT